MYHTRWRWLSLSLVAVAVALLLHSDALIRHFHASSEKIGLLISGPRTDVGDNYYYFTMLRHATERLGEPSVVTTDPDGGDHRNVNAVTNAYAMALYAGHALYRVASAVTPTSRDALLLTSILHTATLALCFVAFVLALTGDARRIGPFAIFMVSALGLIFVDAFGLGMYLGRPYWANSLLTRDPNPLRLVNPTLFWAAGLAAAAFIMRWIRHERLPDFVGAVALAGVTGLFSISVSATLVLALGLFAMHEVVAKRRIPWRLVGLISVAVAGLAWSYLQIRGYATTTMGQELKHGEFLGIAIKWQFLLLFGFVPFLLYAMPGKERSFAIALLASTIVIGMFCESFHLGSRLWLRGAGIYAWGIAVSLGIRLAIDSERLPRQRWWKAAAVLTVVTFVSLAQRPDANSWRGFIERDKWDVFSWMDAHLPAGSIVASPDIEDAYLLPIYTGAKPLYAMYGLTSRSRDEELVRYFFNMALYGRGSQALDEALSLTQQDMLAYYEYVSGGVPRPYRNASADSAIFLHLVMYYAYASGFSKIFSDAEQHRQLEVMLRARMETSKGQIYYFNYAILRKDDPVPSIFSGWENVYQNTQYQLMTNPRRVDLNAKP